METALILRTSTVLLAIAAVGGLVMAGIRFAGNRQPPPALAMLHGFLAAAAVTCRRSPRGWRRVAEQTPPAWSSLIRAEQASLRCRNPTRDSGDQRRIQR